MSYSIGDQVEDVASGNVGTITGPPTAANDYPVDFHGFSTHVNLVRLRRTSELIVAHPLGNPGHPTGSAVQVRESLKPASITERFIIGVHRGDTWQTEITFADRGPAELFAAGMAAGMNWKPRP